jgi:nucleoside-diphosphate-sugar epimerase
MKDRPSEQPAIIVTGSSGLIGWATCERLEEVGYRSFGFDRPGLPHPPEVAEAVDFDVTDPASIDAGLAAVREAGVSRVASVVHLAAYYDFSGAPSDLYEKVTVRGTERLLESLHRSGLEVEQFLFSSTMLVHAPVKPGQRLNEDSPVRGTWAYPKSKVETEAVMRDRRRNIPIVMLRLAGVYTDECRSIPIAHQIQRIYERDLTSRVFPGDSDAGQSFVHLEDVVEAIRLCVDRRRALPPVLPLLVGEEDVMSYRELQHALGELIHGERWPTLEGAYIQEKLPGGDNFIKPWMIDRADDHYAIDASRARDLLGWRPRHALRDTLPKMVELLKADPAKFYRVNKLEPGPPMPAQPAAAPARKPQSV